MTRPSRKEIGKVEISTSPCLRVPSPVVEEGGGGVGWGWGGGEGGAAIWGGGAVDAGYVDEFLASALTRVMRAPVPIPDLVLLLCCNLLLLVDLSKVL